MMLQDRQDIDWREYFDQEVAKYPEIDGHLVEIVRAELHAQMLGSQFPGRKSDTSHQPEMFAGVRQAIADALKTSYQRLRLQRYDEINLGLKRDASSIVVPGSGALYDELDDLLDDDEADIRVAIDPTNPAQPCPERTCSNTVPLPDCDLAADVEAHATGDLVAAYTFPDSEHLQTELALKSNAELRGQLELLLNQRGSDGQLISYLEIREECCAIGEVMNHRGVTPPKLRLQRSLPKLPKDQKYDLPDTFMSRDRQVLDLHWLHCRGKRDQLEHKAYVDLFAEDDFDFDRASNFAAKGWNLASKTIKVLDLMDFEQMQMAFFRMKHIDDAWKNGFLSMNTTISKRLRKYVVKEPEFAVHIEGLKRLWLAEKMVAVADLNGEKIIGQVYGWLMNEEPLAKGTLNAKLKRMRRRTAPKSRRS